LAVAPPLGQRVCDGVEISPHRSDEALHGVDSRLLRVIEPDAEFLNVFASKNGGGRSSIEICDLLSSEKAFVHVKAKTKSSTLSHLFAQGLNSAQAFRDRGFRGLAHVQCPDSVGSHLAGV
jgi:Family of unknown function (DUF6119)